MSTIDQSEIQRIVSQMIPEGTVGSVALRAVATDAITRWESRNLGPQPTYLPADDTALVQIHTPEMLEMVRTTHGVRIDWHEPDNQDISAYVIGNHLDNAMGATVDRNCGELNVIFVKREWSDRSFENSVFRPVAVANLATILSWVTDRA